MLDYGKFKENYLSWHPLADDAEIRSGWDEYLELLEGDR